MAVGKIGRGEGWGSGGGTAAAGRDQFERAGVLPPPPRNRRRAVFLSHAFGCGTEWGVRRGPHRRGVAKGGPGRSPAPPSGCGAGEPLGTGSHLGASVFAGSRVSLGARRPGPQVGGSVSWNDNGGVKVAIFGAKAHPGGPLSGVSLRLCDRRGKGRRAKPAGTTEEVRGATGAPGQDGVRRTTGAGGGLIFKSLGWAHPHRIGGDPK